MILNREKYYSIFFKLLIILFINKIHDIKGLLINYNFYWIIRLSIIKSLKNYYKYFLYNIKNDFFFI